jgi:hypothetical protein
MSIMVPLDPLRLSFPCLGGPVNGPQQTDPEHGQRRRYYRLDAGPKVSDAPFK